MSASLFSRVASHIDFSVYGYGADVRWNLNASEAELQNYVSRQRENMTYILYRVVPQNNANYVDYCLSVQMSQIQYGADYMNARSTFLQRQANRVPLNHLYMTYLVAFSSWTGRFYSEPNLVRLNEVVAIDNANLPRMKSAFDASRSAMRDDPHYLAILPIQWGNPRTAYYEKKKAFIEHEQAQYVQAAIVQSAVQPAAPKAAQPAAPKAAAPAPAPAAQPVELPPQNTDNSVLCTCGLPAEAKPMTRGKLAGKTMYTCASKVCAFLVHK